MSNVIPIVSSSPPPLDDDDGDFKWDDDDDDDEYGNFTCAPTVSGTTINSESSVDVNWSNSKTAAPPHQGSSLGQDIKAQVFKEDFNISQPDRSTSEHMPIDNQSSVKGMENHFPDPYNDDVDFQDFARFDNIDFSEEPAKTLDETEDKKLDVPQDFRSPTAHTESPPAVSGQVGSTAGLTQEDEFQDFAQFNNDEVTAESTNTLATNQPVLTDNSPDASKLDSLSTSSPCSTSDDIHSLGLDLGSDLGASRVQCAGSVPLNNTDSVYSSVSTVDSGIFSNDLSPSLQTGESSDVYLNIDKEDRQTNSGSVEQNSDTFPSSESSASPLDNPTLLEASDGHGKATSALSNMITEDDLDSQAVSDYSNVNCAGDMSSQSDTASSSHAQVDFTNCDTADSMTNVKNAEHLIENVNLSGKEEFKIIVAQSGEQLDHSIQQKVQSVHSTLSTTSDATGDSDSDGPTDFVSSSMSFRSADNEGVLEFQTTRGDIVEQKAAPCSAEVGDDFTEKLQTLNADCVNTDFNIECNTKRSEQSNIVGSAESECLSLAVDHEKPGNLSCDIKCDVGANSELVNEDASSCGLDSPAEVGSDKTLVKCHELQSEVGGEGTAEVEDTEFGEFGDFSTFGCQKVEDSSEVVPITFRTSICETEEGDDDDDFTFNREKPPVCVDDDDDFGEFGAAGVKSSDERTSNEIGECDQTAQGGRSKSDADTDIRGNDDDFGDFDHSEPVDEGASWADFGSATTHPASSDNFGSSTTKPVVSSTSNQSQVQKLQSAVISCFLGGSEADSFVQRTDTSQESQSGDDSQGSNSVSEDESPLPLDMVVDLGLSKALEAKQQTWTLVQHPSKKDPKVRLWAHLKDMDSSHALMYGWHNSHCSKEVYSSLHIDTQNILFSHKKQAIPFFASGLGILEPIRGGGGGGVGVVERKKEKSSAPTTPNILLDSGRQEYRHTPTVQDIPPVDFDWSSSGLTNPLTVFKAEDRETVPPSSQPLEDILKRTTPTAKLATNEVLSAEAIRVLERMPNLSFMQSRVLMFPVKQ
ncbi:unnamed protein product [Candidula unifasciata]|uniref:Aftiphilin clathrin-binding box domain-containing protein n=1 Tax=Candidula unifasciata TaxID=100452 RepID=A0A8S3ZNW0_9EUPU|nr:unnamed protein product [Candidula unifasciata]